MGKTNLEVFHVSGIHAALRTARSGSLRFLLKLSQVGSHAALHAG